MKEVLWKLLFVATVLNALQIVCDIVETLK
jgi:hypothetical protein